MRWAICGGKHRRGGRGRHRRKWIKIQKNPFLSAATLIAVNNDLCALAFLQGLFIAKEIRICSALSWISGIYICCEWKKPFVRVSGEWDLSQSRGWGPLDAILSALKVWRSLRPNNHAGLTKGLEFQCGEVHSKLFPKDSIPAFQFTDLRLRGHFSRSRISNIYKRKFSG